MIDSDVAFCPVSPLYLLRWIHTLLSHKESDCLSKQGVVGAVDVVFILIVLFQIWLPPIERGTVGQAKDVE